jgi:hypothetical protein
MYRRQFAFQRRHTTRIPAGCDYGIPVADESARDSRADARTCPGDQCDFDCHATHSLKSDGLPSAHSIETSGIGT